MGSFSLKTARAMLAAGFAPDTISSDIHDLNVDGPVFDQATTLSKFLALGMPLEDVIRKTTSAPAAAIGRPDLGTLSPGAIGDATVYTIEKEPRDFVDSTGEHFTGSEHIAVSAVVLGGKFLAN